MSDKATCKVLVKLTTGDLSNVPKQSKKRKRILPHKTKSKKRKLIPDEPESEEDDIFEIETAGVNLSNTLQAAFLNTIGLQFFCTCVCNFFGKMKLAKKSCS